MIHTDRQDTSHSASTTARYNLRDKLSIKSANYHALRTLERDPQCLQGNLTIVNIPGSFGSSPSLGSSNVSWHTWQSLPSSGPALRGWLA
jgi:hypothetical protein